MREELANLVHPLLREALTLHEQWQAGTGPSFEAGRTDLRRQFEAIFRAEKPGPITNEPHPTSTPVDLLADPLPAVSTRYLGAGYPLASWLDELFTLHSIRAAEWNERKFEIEFYGSNDRAWRVWQQARMAADLPKTDDLEVFFICMGLGFRGEWAEDPTALQAWTSSTRDRLLKDLRREWIAPPALDPPRGATPRRAAYGLRRMAVVGTVFSLLAIPAAAVMIARHFFP
ncbi:MAG: DotU family type IV/VI secretion system protein [Planctomycetes bacterium]|nr:DotU family type IV/VI secretion system protein [Planctomycetota bacterium]